MPPNKRSSLRELVASDPDPSRPATPEPTTSTGVARGRALYDSPPPDSQSEDLGRAQRRRRSTSRGIAWTEEVQKSATRSKRNRRTRARKARKTQTVVPGTFPDDDGTDGDSQATSANPLTSRSDDEGEETDEVPESVGAPETQEPATNADSSSGDHMWIEREGFVAVASAAFGEDLSNESTQALQHLYDFTSAYQTPPVDASSRGSSIVVLPGPPLGVGGGWHLDQPANNTTAANNPENVNSQSSKRRSAAPDSNASKRQRTEIIVDDSNTDTVSESDLELEPLPPPLFQSTPRPSASPPVNAPPGNRVIRTVTQTTQPESQPDPLSPAPQYLSTGSLSLGGSNHSDHNPRPSVRTYLGTRSYTSANVQALRYPPHDSNTPTATSATLTAPTRSAPRPPPAPSPQAGPPALPAQPISRLQASSRAQPSSRAPTIPGSLSAPHPRQPGSGPPSNANPPLRQPSTAQPRSSVHPQHPSQRPSQAPSSQRPSSQRPSSQRSSLQRPSSQRLSSQRPSIQRSARGVQDARSRPRDPVALAKMDMVEFNHAQREEQDRSLADSAARHLRYVEAERARLSPDPSYRLVEDDEQIRECAKAIVSGVPMISKRKKKPRSSDSTGLSGQVLCLAKLGLFGLACSQGPYQTRGRLLHWARLVHEETWNHEAPDIPYVAATKGELAVMVNNLATLRGRVKDRMRPVIQEGYGFRPFAVSQEDIQYNRELYARLTPNNFHCTQFTPRAGHYENGEIFHAVAAAFFHGPNSIAVLFPEYFDDMALEVIAFVLAMMQFCIEEWINGWFEPKDLSAGNMLDKYDSHLFGLKEAAAVAPERMEFLQYRLLEWTEDYSRASTSRQNGGQERIHRSEIRPDTPPPAPPVEEDDTLVEYNEEGRLTARAKGKRRGN